MSVEESQLLCGTAVYIGLYEDTRYWLVNKSLCTGAKVDPTRVRVLVS